MEVRVTPLGGLFEIDSRIQADRDRVDIKEVNSHVLQCTR